MWAAGRNQSRATGIVAALAALAVLDDPGAGVTHLHERTSLASLGPKLQRYGISTGARVVAKVGFARNLSSR